MACYLTGLSKAGLGGTLGFLITPMLALVMPLDKAVGLRLPILILGDMFTLSVYWRRWEVRFVWILLLVGVWTGRRLITRMDKGVFEEVILVLILASGLLLLIR